MSGGGGGSAHFSISTLSPANRLGEEQPHTSHPDLTLNAEIAFTRRIRL